MSNLYALKLEITPSRILAQLAIMIHLTALVCLLSTCIAWVSIIGVLMLVANCYFFYRKDWLMNRDRDVISMAYQNNLWILSTKNGDELIYESCREKLALERVKLLEFTGTDPSRKSRCLLIFKDQLRVHYWHHMSLILNLNN